MRESELPVRIDRAARIPLATQLAQQVRWLITEGRLPAGDLLPPARDLAARLGINQHTVRAAYQQLARDGLVESRPGRGTTVLAFDPELLASSASKLPSFTVGVILPEVSPFYRPFLHGIDDGSVDSSSILLIGSAREDPERGLRYLDRLLARQVDGIIVASPILPEREALSRRRALPVVFTDWPGGPDPAIDFDLEAATVTGTTHLIDHGHTRIAFLSPPRSWENIRPRQTGYERALRAAGLEPDPDLTVNTPNFDVAPARTAALELLDRPDPPTAIVTAGDFMAIGCYQAAQRRGVRIPTDLAIIGGDGAPDIALDPTLTTTQLPSHEMGVAAMRMLQDLIAGSTPHPPRHTLQPRFITGGSCGCIAGTQTRT